MKTILVVDDEFDISEVICSILKLEGHSALALPDGREAIKYLADHKESVGLVILDVMMPFVSGYEVLRFIRSENGLEKLPVILMSAVQPAEKKEVYLWDEFLKKPFQIERFETLVAKYIKVESSSPFGEYSK